jgi:3-oxoacid CoA-transferase A subunit
MIDKRVAGAAAAIAGLKDGDTVMVSGFQGSGMPNALLDAVLEHDARHLTLIANGAGQLGSRTQRLIEAGRIDKLICSSARSRGRTPGPFEDRWSAGQIELELVAQGTFVERIRAGGAGIPAFYTPVAVGTALAEGKEHRHFNGREHVLETALTADMTLLRAKLADRWGNLTYRGVQRNFGHVMTSAGAITVAEVERVLNDEPIPSHRVHTPGIFVQRVISLPDLR